MWFRHETTNGTRMPPSRVVRFPPRSGVVVRGVDGRAGHDRAAVVAEEDDVGVFGLAGLVEFGEHAADVFVHGIHHRGVGAAFFVGDLREFLEAVVGRVHGRVDGVEGEIEEPRLVFMSWSMKATGFAAEGVGEIFFAADGFVRRGACRST